MTTTAEQVAPGLHRNVPFLDYLRWPILSQSALKEGRASMAHLKAAIDGDRVKEVTDDMALGTALHTCFLEPERMVERVALWDGGARRGKAWDEFRGDNGGKTILTPGYHENLVGMVKAMRRHPIVRQWSGKIEDVEVSAVGEVCGIEMKGRCDALTSDPLFDVKKVRSADPRQITSTVMAFGYHIQAFIYRVLFNRDRFVLLCVEGTPPFDVVPFELSPSFLRAGEHDAMRLLERYAACAASGVWPGRSDEVVTLEAPEWLASGSEVTLGGESAFEEE